MECVLFFFLSQGPKHFSFGLKSSARSFSINIQTTTSFLTNSPSQMIKW